MNYIRVISKPDRKSLILSRWLSWSHINSLSKKNVPFCPRSKDAVCISTYPLLFFSFLLCFVMNRQESEAVRRRRRLRAFLLQKFVWTWNRTFVTFLKESVGVSSSVLFQYFAWGLHYVFLQENSVNFCERSVQGFWCISQMMKYIV